MSDSGGRNLREENVPGVKQVSDLLPTTPQNSPSRVITQNNNNNKNTKNEGFTPQYPIYTINFTKCEVVVINNQKEAYYQAIHQLGETRWVTNNVFSEFYNFNDRLILLAEKKKIVHLVPEFPRKGFRGRLPYLKHKPATIERRFIGLQQYFHNLLLVPHQLFYKITLDFFLPTTKKNEQKMTRGGGDTIIDKKEIRKLSLIGKGSFAEVYLAKWKNRNVALKIFNAPNGSEEEARCQQFITEAYIMRTFNHNNILKFYGITSNQTSYEMVLEYLENGDLYKFIKEKYKEVTFNQKINWALQIADGMQYLHSFQPPVLHRDLKSPNILIDKKMVVKIADFGLAKIYEDTIMTICGSPIWQAPEMIEDKRYTEKVDVYSYGIILYEIFTGNVPYKEVKGSTHVLLNKICQGLRPSIPENANIPNKILELMKQCWDGDENQRPTFEYIVSILKEFMQSNQIPNLGAKRHCGNSTSDDLISRNGSNRKNNIRANTNTISSYGSIIIESYKQEGNQIIKKNNSDCTNYSSSSNNNNNNNNNNNKNRSNEKSTRLLQSQSEILISTSKEKSKKNEKSDDDDDDDSDEFNDILQRKKKDHYLWEYSFKNTSGIYLSETGSMHASPNSGYSDMFQFSPNVPLTLYDSDERASSNIFSDGEFDEFDRYRATSDSEDIFAAELLSPGKNLPFSLSPSQRYAEKEGECKNNNNNNNDDDDGEIKIENIKEIDDNVLQYLKKNNVSVIDFSDLNNNNDNNNNNKSNKNDSTSLQTHQPNNNSSDNANDQQHASDYDYYLSMNTSPTSSPTSKENINFSSSPSNDNVNRNNNNDNIIIEELENEDQLRKNVSERNDDDNNGGNSLPSHYPFVKEKKGMLFSNRLLNTYIRTREHKSVGPDELSFFQFDKPKTRQLGRPLRQMFFFPIKIRNNSKRQFLVQRVSVEYLNDENVSSLNISWKPLNTGEGEKLYVTPFTIRQLSTLEKIITCYIYFPTLMPTKSQPQHLSRLHPSTPFPLKKILFRINFEGKGVNQNWSLIVEYADPPLQLPTQHILVKLIPQNNLFLFWNYCDDITSFSRYYYLVVKKEKGLEITYNSTPDSFSCCYPSLSHFIKIISVLSESQNDQQNYQIFHKVLKKPPSTLDDEYSKFVRNHFSITILPSISGKCVLFGHTVTYYCFVISQNKVAIGFQFSITVSQEVEGMDISSMQLASCNKYYYIDRAIFA